MNDRIQNFEELEKNVIDWADKIGILQSSTSKDQFTKTVEEVGEIAAAIARDDIDMLKDAIGDTFVTLILLCRINGLMPIGCLNEAWNQIKDRTGVMRNGVFVKDDG